MRLGKEVGKSYSRQVISGYCFALKPEGPVPLTSWFIALAFRKAVPYMSSAAMSYSEMLCHKSDAVRLPYDIKNPWG